MAIMQTAISPALDQLGDKIMHKGGFFTCDFEQEYGKNYVKLKATFVCDKVGLVPVTEYFSDHAREETIINRVIRFKEFYFESRERWEKAYGDDAGEES